MITSIENRVARGGILDLGFLLAALLATMLSGAPADAVVPPGKAFAWGKNASGQLGDGTYLPGLYETTPVRIANLSGVEAVATGAAHTLPLPKSARVKSWGSNYAGELGNGTHGLGTDRSTPGNVIGLSNVRSISGGAYHSLAVLESGAVRSWGSNGSGELGNGASGADTASDIPVNVKNPSNVGSIDGGDGFTLAATQ